MRLLIDQLLLLGSLAALGAAGLRWASVAVPGGLLRALAAVTLAVAAAVLSALGLGQVGLGSDPVALSLVAAGIWLTVRIRVATSGPRASHQLATWWVALPAAGRVALTALAGAGIGYAIWTLRHPVLGLDALTDHLALPVGWVHNGRPGSIFSVNDQVPYEDYPNTYEVLITWVTGIARTLVPMMLVTPAMLLLLAASVRAGLAEMGLPARLGWLASATLATLPLVVVQLPGPNTDLPAMAWLACTAALAAGARRRPGLLAVAVVAAGLAAGIKTTVIPLAALALISGGWSCRAQLRGLLAPLLWAAVVAVVIGGLWYVRNLIEHGAPFWPLTTTPWGDPIPGVFRAIQPSLLSHPGATLGGRLGDYERALAGGLVLLVGAILSPVWAQRREVRWAAVIVVVALLAWAAAPYTGISSNTELAVGATRYLLPCLLAAAVTLALAGASWPGPSLALLTVALGFNLDRDLGLRFPAAPSPASLGLAAAIGAALGLGLELLGRAQPQPLRWRWPARGAAAALASLGLATALSGLLLPVDGFMAGHAGAGLFDAGLVRWLHARAAFRTGSQPVAVGPVAIAVLTGARLAHPLVLLRENESCLSIERRRRRGWVIVQIEAAAQRNTEGWLTCLAGARPAYGDSSFVVFAPAALTVPVS